MLFTSYDLPIDDKHSIPSIGLGTYRLTGDEGKQSIEKAIDLGYRHIDTADYYTNHQIVGEAIKRIEREKIFLTTKLPLHALGHREAIDACHRFLKELDTPYLDLLMIHWPSPITPLSETFKAFDELVKKGLVKSVGVSNFTIPLLEEALQYTPHIAVNQVEYHPYLNQKKLYEFCIEHKILLQACRPLCKGILTDNPSLSHIAANHNASAFQVTLAWLLKKGIVCIPKASSTKHLKENLNAKNLKLSVDEISIIENLNRNLRLFEPPASSINNLFSAEKSSSLV